MAQKPQMMRRMDFAGGRRGEGRRKENYKITTSFTPSINTFGADPDRPIFGRVHSHKYARGSKRPPKGDSHAQRPKNAKTSGPTNFLISDNLPCTSQSRCVHRLSCPVGKLHSLSRRQQTWKIGCDRPLRSYGSY